MSQSKSLTEIKEAEFLFGAASSEQIRKQGFPEVAVIGRSNVGKSSFVNRMLGKTIAKVSARPGCTQQLNFFRVRGELKKVKFLLALVDLPGFGYAKLPKEQREEISRSAIGYLRDREQLRVVLLLNDCRRLPEADELAVQKTCADSGVSCLIVVTKTDVLRQSEKTRSLAEIARGYHLEPGDILIAGKEQSADSVWERILPIL